MLTYVHMYMQSSLSIFHGLEHRRQKPSEKSSDVNKMKARNKLVF